jgi:uncharacterized membrane protein
MHQRNSLVRFVQRRPRVVAALLLGLGVAVATPDVERLVTRFLIGWNVAVWAYLVLMGWLMMRASPARVRTIAEREDPSAIVVLALLSAMAVASLAAIVAELAAVRGEPFGQRLLHYAFTGSTLLGSWLMLHTLFTFHYAHVFYRAAADAQPLRFPDDATGNPDYWDFLYFSFTIGVAAQTSDVVVTTSPMRKAVLAQSVLGFFFNVAIIGMSINVAAGLIGG